MAMSGEEDKGNRKTAVDIIKFGNNQDQVNTVSEIFTHQKSMTVDEH